MGKIRFLNPREAAMNEARTSTEEILVHFVRPGVGSRDYRPVEGATLADLLRLSGISTASQAVFIDGVPPEEALPLRDGAVVMIVPRPGGTAGEEPWRASVSALRDQDIAREYSEAMKARWDAPSVPSTCSMTWSNTSGAGGG
jgi:hypothetical protein